MVPNQLFDQFLLGALVMIWLLLHVWWPDDLRITPQKSLQPDTTRRRRSKEPRPFTGLIHQPLCKACEQGADTRPKAPGSPPPVITFKDFVDGRVVDSRCPSGVCRYGQALPLHARVEPPEDQVKDAVIAQFALWPALGHREVRQEKCAELGFGELDRDRRRCRLCCRCIHRGRASCEQG